jgi:uncharacterized protein (TIGR02996 family)
VKRNPELEALIIAKPEDREAHQVYADWLIGEGDPLGELVATSLAAEKESKKARQLKVRARKLLVDYAVKELVPRFPRLEQRLVESARGKATWPTFEWRWGLLRGFSMDAPRRADAADGWNLLTDPIAQFVDHVLIQRMNVPDLRKLAALRCLLDLNLHHARGVEDVKALAKHPRLAYLTLTGTGITDVKPLATLPELRQLYLNETKVKDIAPLAKARSLELVNLEWSFVTDIRPLYDLPILWEVWLHETRVPERQVNELKARMYGPPVRKRKSIGPGLSDTPIVYSEF